MLNKGFPERLPPSYTRRPRALDSPQRVSYFYRVNLSHIEWDRITYDMIRLTLDQKPYLPTQAPKFADLIYSALHTLYSTLNMTPRCWKQTASSPWSLRVQLQSQKKKWKAAPKLTNRNADVVADIYDKTFCFVLSLFFINLL